MRSVAKDRLRRPRTSASNSTYPPKTPYREGPGLARCPCSPPGYVARASLSCSGVVTGAWQVNWRQTYAAGAPLTSPRPASNGTPEPLGTSWPGTSWPGTSWPGTSGQGAVAEGEHRAGRRRVQRRLVQRAGPLVLRAADHRDLGRPGQPGLGHRQAHADRARVPGRDAGEHAEGGPGSLPVPGRAGQRGVAQERSRYGERAGWRGVVGRVGRAEDQLLIVGGRVEEPALTVAEGAEHDLEQLAGQRHPVRLARHPG